MLGAVVLEHPPQVAQAADRDDVADEDRGAQDPLDEPEQQRRAELVLDQAGRADRDDEEEADREDQRQRDRQRPRRSRRSAPAPLPPRARSARWPRSPAPGSRSAATPPAPPPRGSPASAAPGGASPRRPAAPRSPRSAPSGLRTATAQVETPRIITPSSTAWPPTGASRLATGRPSGIRASARRGRPSSAGAPSVDGGLWTRSVTVNFIGSAKASLSSPAPPAAHSAG